MTWLPLRRSRESHITSTSVHHPHLKENTYGGLVSFLKGSTVLCHQVMVFPLGVEPGDVLAFRLLTNRWGFTAEGAGTSPGVLQPCFLGGPKWWMSPMRLDRLHSILLLWESSWLREMDWCLVWRWALSFFFKFDVSEGQHILWCILDLRPFYLSTPFRSIPSHSVLCTPYAIVMSFCCFVAWEECMLHLMKWYFIWHTIMPNI